MYRKALNIASDFAVATLCGRSAFVCFSDSDYASGFANFDLVWLFMSKLLDPIRKMDKRRPRKGGDGEMTDEKADILSRLQINWDKSWEYFFDWYYIIFNSSEWPTARQMLPPFFQFFSFATSKPSWYASRSSRHHFLGWLQQGHPSLRVYEKHPYENKTTAVVTVFQN